MSSDIDSPSPRQTGAQRTLLQRLFWLVLAGFLVWDFYSSAPVDLRNEPPLIAAGSGRAASGGHCSLAR